jgi:subtilisin family serine protease
VGLADLRVLYQDRGMRIHYPSGLIAAAVVVAACGSGNDENNSPSAVVIIGGNHQSGGAGGALALPLTVEVNDRQGDAVKGAAVTFTVTAGGGSVRATTVSTDASGQASTIWTLGTTAGSPSTATAGVAGVTPATFIATVIAAPVATATLVAGGAQTGAVGSTLAQPLVAEFRDGFNNVATGIPVSWMVTGGGGSLTNNQITTDAQGRASATWTLGLEFGTGHTATATAGGIAATANASATLDAGTTLAIASGDAQAAVGGTALGAPIGVRVRTATAQNIAKVPVTWAVASGGGSLSTTASLTDANGVAITGWTLGGSAGAQTVTASNAATTPTSVTLTATAVALAPSSITGSVTLSNSLVSSASGRQAALRSAPIRGNTAQRSEASFPSMSRVRKRRQAPDYATDELIVRFRRQAVNAPIGIRAMASMATAQAVGQTMRQQLSRHAAEGKVAVTGVSPVILMARLKVADRSRVDSVARALAADPAVESVGRNGWMRADGPVRQGLVPNDPFYTTQSWNYTMVDLPRLWSTTTGSANVIVAVLDNGAVFFHPTVGAAGATGATGGGNYRNDGYDFVSMETVSLCSALGGTIDNAGDGTGYDPDPSTPDDRDPDGQGFPCGRSQLGAHGTHVAGTIGAKGNDGVAAVGANWTVGIRPVRVLGIDGGSYFDIANGVLYAAGLPADNGSGGVLTPPAQPARIINMSLGGPCPAGPDPLHAAIQTVTNPALANPAGGVLVVVSAGNEAFSVAPCPAAYDEVIAVGAVDPSGHRTTYSNFGSFVDVAAPGGDFPMPGGAVPDPAIGPYGILSATCDFRSFPAPCTPNHAFYVGTSMASPHVAGIAALLLAANPGLTAADLRSRLIGYATPIDPGEQIGTGIVNARNAYTMTLEPSHQLLVRAINSTTGQLAATVTANGGAFTINGLADGSYYVVAGQDDDGDGQIGLPGRRFGAFGGVSSPTAVNVSTAAGGFAGFTVGYPVEEDPNDDTATPNVLVVDGAVQGSLTDADQVDFFKVAVPTLGTYTFETTGLNGAFCGFALDADTIMDLLNPGLATLQTSVDIDPSSSVRNFCSRISLTLAPGNYLVKIRRDELSPGVPSNGRYLLQARSGP